MLNLKISCQLHFHKAKNKSLVINELASVTQAL